VYRLICLQGQKAPQSFILKEGDNIIGRSEGVDLKVESNGVSKKHVSINLSGGSLYVTDLNSKNGTFVNGVLVKKKDISAGDKIGVFDHVFQVVEGANAEYQSIPGLDIDNKDYEDFKYKGDGKAKSKNLRANINEFINKTMMPFFEYLMKRFSITGILTIILSLMFAVVVLIVTVPIIEFDEFIISREASQRGIYLSKLLVENNRNTVSLEGEDSPSVEAIADSPGVKVALISDPEGRILAPSDYVGDQVSGVAMNRIKEIISGGVKSYKEITSTGADVYSLGEGDFLITAPIEDYSEEEDNVSYVGFAIINYSTNAIRQSLSGAWQRVLIGIIIAVFIGFFIALVFSKIFNLPFLKLYDELDLAMKGETRRVNMGFSSKSIIDLTELVNILIRKSKKANVVDDVSDLFSNKKESIDEQQVFENVGKVMKKPFFVLDTSNSIITANPAFGNISSYKASNWSGVALVDAVKEQKIVGLILNLISKIESIGEDISEDVMVDEKLHRISVSGIKNDDGAFIYYFVGVDIV
jgi:pSer/pThr/pTyr-binding forkhead associated (FHA) protein/PAS domain-containing protein